MKKITLIIIIKKNIKKVNILKLKIILNLEHISIKMKKHYLYHFQDIMIVFLNLMEIVVYVIYIV